MKLLDRYTIPSLLEHTFSRYSERNGFSFVGKEQYTYADMQKEIAKVGNQLVAIDVKKGDKVAILAANSPSWVATYMALGAMGATIVPILPDFSDKEVAHILEHSEAKAIFVSPKMYVKIPSELKDNGEVSIFNIDNFALVPTGTEQEDFAKITPRNLSSEGFEYRSVDEQDLLAIIYTTGTTGSSKGVMLTHKNILFNVEQSKKMQPVTEEDRFFSILPLSHTYENTVGMLIAFVSGSATYYLDKLPTPKVLLPALGKVKPTVMLTVPLIIEKIYKTQVIREINKNKITKLLYKLRPFKKILNKVAGKKVYESFGGRLTFFGIGGAKLDAIVEQFLLDCDFPYAIGYGMTETAPLIAGAIGKTRKLGSAGAVADDVQLRIFKKNPSDKTGEVQVKGENVMQGYYKAPHLTEEVFTENGWLRTGDLGVLDKRGHLCIKGRLKTMIVGASGENIYPEEIESVINKIDVVLESLVTERGGKLVAMVHLNMEELEAQAKRFHKNMISFRDDVVQRKDDAKNYVENKVDETLKEIQETVNQELNRFSQIQQIILQPMPFEKTPTKKVKRFLYT